MENTPTLMESLLEHAKEYAKTSVDLIKLKVVEKSAELVSSVVPNAMVCTMIAMTNLFANIGMAFWLGEILEKTYLGFLAISGFNGFLFIVFYLFFYKCTKKRIQNKIIKKMLN